MTFQSPVHILFNKDLSQINATNLKKWRKELMLRFDLDGATTIRLDGQNFDKNTILQSFERLQKDTNFHIQLYENKALLNFLEKGELYFFLKFYHWEDIKDVDFWNWLQPIFIPKLQELLYKYVSNPFPKNIEKLKIITNSGFQLPNYLKEDAYAKAFQHFDNLIRTGRDKFESPFYGKSPRLVKKELKEYLNKPTFEALKLMPPSFVALKKNYGVFAHNVVYDALKHRVVLKKFSRDALLAIKTAMEIDIEFRNDPESKKLIKLVEEALKGTGSGATGCAPDAAKIPLFFVMLVIFLFRLGLAVDSCNKPSSRRYDQLPQLDYQKQVPIQFDTSELIGAWKNKLPQRWAGDTISYEKTMTLFDDSLGVMTFVFPTGKGEKECTITNFFNWKVQQFNNMFNWHELNLTYTTFAIKNGDSTDLAVPNRKVLENIKKKLSSKKESIRLLTHQMLHDNRSIKVINPKGYIYTEVPKSISNYYSRNKRKEFKKFQKISKANLAKYYLVERFKVDRGSTDKIKIRVSPDDFLATIKYWSMKADTLGDFKFKKGKLLFNPTRWYQEGDPCSVSGRFHNIQYLDKEGKYVEGDLEVCFHYNEGYFLKPVGQLTEPSK